MIASYSKGFVDSVIPKTASSTLRDSMKNWIDIGPLVTDHNPYVVPLLQVMGTAFEEIYIKYKSLSSIRNSYDRIYSGFRQEIHASQVLEKWTNAKTDIFESIGYSFSEYLQEYVAKADIVNDWRWICFCPMHYCIEYGDYEIRYTGMYKNFESVILELAEYLGLELIVKNVLNSRYGIYKERSYLAYYSKNDIDQVHEFYRKDCIKLEYKMIHL